MQNNLESTEKPLCPRTEETGAYLLSATDAEERLEFERHLEGCEACRAAVAGFGDVVAGLKGAKSRQIARDLTPAIMSQIPESEWGSNDEARSMPWFAFPLRLAAVLVIGLGTGVLLYRYAGTEKPAGAPDVAAVGSPAKAAPVKVIPADATRSALAWLKNTQKADGGWDVGQSDGQKHYAIGVSSLALVAFMENDPKVFEGPNAETVRRGIDYLLKNQSEEGLIGPAFSGAPYNQGLATIAILKAVQLTRNEKWQAAADKSVAYLGKLQDSTGGWGYLKAKAGDVNSSASIWPLQALIVADSMGYSGLRPNIVRGLAWLKTTVNQEGFMGYTKQDDFPNGQHDTLTAAGALCFLMTRKDSSAGASQPMMASVRRVAAKQDKAVDFYEVFFVARALEFAKDDQTGQLLDALQGKIASRQKADGGDAGSWDASDQWGPVGGRVYSTAMAAMVLRQQRREI